MPRVGMGGRRKGSGGGGVGWSWKRKRGRRVGVGAEEKGSRYGGCWRRLGDFESKGERV